MTDEEDVKQPTRLDRLVSVAKVVGATAQFFAALAVIAGVKLALEQIAAQAAQIDIQNDQLSIQNEQLRIQNTEVRLRNELVALEALLPKMILTPIGVEYDGADNLRFRLLVNNVSNFPISGSWDYNLNVFGCDGAPLLQDVFIGDSENPFIEYSDVAAGQSADFYYSLNGLIGRISSGEIAEINRDGSATVVIVISPIFKNTFVERIFPLFENVEPLDYVYTVDNQQIVVPPFSLSRKVAFHIELVSSDSQYRATLVDGC